MSEPVVSAQELLQTRDCSFPRCVNEAAFGQGPYAGLCEFHAKCEAEKADAPRAQWTREAIAAALKAWAEKHGETPYHSQWKVRADGRPTAQTVLNAFGSWDAALEAAGLAARYPVTVAPVEDAEVTPGPVTHITVTWKEGVSGDTIRRLSREVGRDLSILEETGEVRTRTEGTVGVEAEAFVAPAPVEVPAPASADLTPDEWLEWGEADRLRLEYIELLLERLAKTTDAHMTFPVDLAERIERLLWGDSAARSLPKRKPEATG